MANASVPTKRTTKKNAKPSYALRGKGRDPSPRPDPQAEARHKKKRSRKSKNKIQKGSPQPSSSVKSPQNSPEQCEESAAELSHHRSTPSAVSNLRETVRALHRSTPSTALDCCDDLIGVFVPVPNHQEDEKTDDLPTATQMPSSVDNSPPRMTSSPSTTTQCDSDDECTFERFVDNPSQFRKDESSSSDESSSEQQPTPTRRLKTPVPQARPNGKRRCHSGRPIARAKKDQLEGFLRGKGHKQHFKILGHLGKGAYGHVYKVVNVYSMQVRAIKTIDTRGKEQKKKEMSEILKEAKIMASLPNHQNIVRFFGCFQARGHRCIVLEYVELLSLKTHMKAVKRVCEDTVASWLSGILSGLAFLHENGIIHRDIKAANVLVTCEGVVKLADLGVAIHIKDTKAKKVDAIGSPYWMAPEIVRSVPCTPACDIWAVGATAMELSTGKPPFFDLIPQAALFIIADDDRNTPRIPKDTPTLLRDFMMQCFQKDPSQRPSASRLKEHPFIRSVTQPVLLKFALRELFQVDKRFNVSIKQLQQCVEKELNERVDERELRRGLILAHGDAVMDSFGFGYNLRLRQRRRD